MARHPLRVSPVDAISVADASGRILAASIVAPEDVPPFARSRVDGYAVVSADVRGAAPERPVRLTIAGEVRMGSAADISLHAGQAIRIPTGGMLPAGADAVVMIEDTSEFDGVVEIRDESHCADNVTPASSDIRAGQHLLPKGAVLDPASIGMLAAAGIARVDVYRRPLVGLLVTGDELVAPGEPLRSGEIRDINRYSIAAALAAMGCACRAYERIPDEREAFAHAFWQALTECDAIVISGGSSVGKRDYTPEVVGAAGKPGVVIHGVRVKPGRPTLLGVIGDKPIIGLPGNPVSALVMLESLGKPILLRMFEKTDDTLPYCAVLAAPIGVDGKLEYRVPVKLDRSPDGGLIAKPIAGTSAHMHILGMADAIAVVPIGIERIPAGTVVDCIPFTRPTTLR